LPQSMMNAGPIIPSGRNFDLHAMGHGQGDMGDCADIMAWHVRHFARLASKLRDTYEVDGSRVLDHTAMFMAFEGGNGPYDGNDGAAVTTVHSVENMAVIVAGGAGGLKCGQHIHFNNNRHPGQVILTMMNAVGCPGPLGEVSEANGLGPIPELFKA